MWYGVWFVLGLALGYIIFIQMVKRNLESSKQFGGFSSAKEASFFLTDRLLWAVILGILIGSRLGFVLFYDWAYFKEHPGQIVKVWNGGLASHGGALGVILSMAIYRYFIAKSFPDFTLLAILDRVSVPAALVGFFIRIGNFFNQEILGTPSNLPWAVVFGHPMDFEIKKEGFNPPRHPVQLYEGLFYLLIFFFLFWFWKRGQEKLKNGVIFGLCLILIFTTRLLLEFLKISQGGFMDQSLLSTGQWLSIPFVLVGFFFLFRKNQKSSVNPK
jgi:prolipoprotein diacylglyceryl transferase